MKETKFRALIDDMNCKWVYGNLIYNKGGIYGERTPRIQIDESDCLFVTCLAGTEGQFTGLKDKNGVDIYEGDKVYREYCNGKFCTEQTYEVKYIDYRIQFVEIDGTDQREIYGFRDYDMIKQKRLEYINDCIPLEVIGNIHDNTKEESL